MSDGPPDLSVREAVDRWLDKQRVSKSDSTVSAYRYRLKLFVEWCEDNGIDRVAALSAWDLDSYETERRGRGVAPTTLDNELTTLRLWLRWTDTVGLTDDLAAVVDTVDLDAGDEVDETRLPATQARALLGAYRERADLRATRGHVLLELLWSTGARIGAVRGLDVSDALVDQQFVEFVHRPDTETPLKNAESGRRAVAITEETAAVLDEWLSEGRPDVADEHGRLPLIPSRAGRPTAGTLREWTYRATVPCVFTDCPHGRERDTCEFLVEHNRAGGCPSSRSPHQVRTGAIRWMLDRGVPREVVADRVDSSPAVIEQHYDPASERDAMLARRAQYIEDLQIDHDSE